MASVTIRNLDEAVVARLKNRARLNNRSLEAELRQLLSHASANENTLDRAALVERITSLSHRPFYEDSAVLLREDRER